MTTTAATVMISRGANGVKEKETRSARGDAKLRDAVRLSAQGDVLEDEPVHWATLGIAGALDVALLVQAAQQQQYPMNVAMAVVLGYVLADLGTGVFHWSVDNYGGPNTPVFGKVIAAFQGHHRQ